MDFSQRIPQHIIFPRDCSQQFVSYTFELLIACGGLPGMIHFGQGIQEFDAVFFSPETQGKFNEQYGKALQGNFAVSIWEKVNGPIISEGNRLCLLEFHKVLKEIKPVIKFIEENGGWPTPNELNGLKPLEDALHHKALPLELKVSSDKFKDITMTFFFVCDTLTRCPKIESLPKGNSNIHFKMNSAQLYNGFGVLYAKMLPLIEFIEANGGWPESEGGDFPGFAVLRSTCSAGKLPQEVMTSLDDIEYFMHFYLMGDEFMRSQKAIIQVTPHNQV